MPVVRSLQRIHKIAFSFKKSCCFYSVVRMSTEWESEKDRIMSFPIEEKRKLYKSDDYIILNRVDSWCKYFAENKGLEAKNPTAEDVTEFRKIKIDSEKNKELADKVSIFKGDITKLEVIFMYYAKKRGREYVSSLGVSGSPQLRAWWLVDSDASEAVLCSVSLAPELPPLLILRSGSDGVLHLL